MAGRSGTVVVAVASLLLFAAPCAAAAGEMFTLGGTGRLGASRDGRLATTVALQPWGAVAVRDDGGVVIVDWPRVRAIEPDGTIRTIGGRRRPGFSGDGGPATAAHMRPTDVAIAADGGIFVAECTNQRVRRIAPDGTIATVAGSGPVGPALDENFGGDGGPATAARLACPAGVDELPNGGFVIADYDNGRVRRVDPDGVIETIAGRSRLGGRRGDGGPATRAHLSPEDVAVAGDGGVLVADALDGRVRRVGLNGTITTVAGGGRLARDGVPAVKAAMAPYGVAALSEGGFLIADAGGAASGAGTEPRVRRVDAGGRVITVAGSGRFVPDPPRGNENRGDGGPARSADLLAVSDVAVAPDGGVIIAEGWSFLSAKRAFGGLIRYVAPAAPGRFALAVRRDRHRSFASDGPPSVSVALTHAATVQLEVWRGPVRVMATEAALPAGASRVPLAAHLTAVPHRVRVTAIDALGRRAFDRATIQPRQWLASVIARHVAAGLVFRVTRWDFASGQGISSCRRLAINRIDCRLEQNERGCDLVVSVRLGADRRVRWGSYRCPVASRPRWRRKLHPVGRRDTICSVLDTSCRALHGRVPDKLLVPWG